MVSESTTAIVMICALLHEVFGILGRCKHGEATQVTAAAVRKFIGRTGGNADAIACRNRASLSRAEADGAIAARDADDAVVLGIRRARYFLVTVQAREGKLHLIARPDHPTEVVVSSRRGIDVGHERFRAAVAAAAAVSVCRHAADTSVTATAMSAVICRCAANIAVIAAAATVSAHRHAADVAVIPTAASAVTCRRTADIAVIPTAASAVTCRRAADVAVSVSSITHGKILSVFSENADGSPVTSIICAGTQFVHANRAFQKSENADTVGVLLVFYAYHILFLPAKKSTKRNHERSARPYCAKR